MYLRAQAGIEIKHLLRKQLANEEKQTIMCQASRKSQAINQRKHNCGLNLLVLLIIFLILY